VVGNVVRLRRELAWFERLPLFGRRVLVTRSPEQAGSLCRALEEAGAEPVRVPTIRIVHETPLLGDLGGYEAIVFTSANAVHALAALGRRAGQPPSALRASALCVGPATSEAAAAEGFAVTRLDGPVGDAAALRTAVQRTLPVAGLRLLWPRAAAAGPELARGLREAGAHVDDVVVYRTEPAPFDAAALAAELAAGSLHALTFASPSAARSFASGMGPDGMAAARRVVVAAIGQVTADALRSLGLPADAVAERPEPAALVVALAGAVGRREKRA
jgi:uroporphyrinogen III methyltransferase/synthase